MGIGSSAIGGSLAGAGAGAATGAAIGSVVPVVGTAIGGLLGAGVGGLLGGASGAGFGAEAESIDPKKNFKDLSWGDRVATTMASKAEGLAQGVAGFFGLEDYVGSENQDLLANLNHKRSDNFGISFQSGGNITGGSAGGQTSPQMGGAGVGGASPNQGISLGRALALEDEPALQQTNYNNNNFSF
jgi:hypothetical protein